VRSFQTLQVPGLQTGDHMVGLNQIFTI